MNAGIVRRIDELGRIVIPKELRRTMRLNEGDEMAISADGDNIVLKKYSGIESIMSTVKSISKILAQTTGGDVLFVNPNRVLSAEGANKKHYINVSVSEKFARTIRSRRAEILHGDDIGGLLCDREVLGYYMVIEPIVVCGDLIGCAVLVLDNLPSDIARTYLKFCVELVQSTLSC